MDLTVVSLKKSIGGGRTDLASSCACFQDLALGREGVALGVVRYILRWIHCRFSLCLRAGNGREKPVLNIDKVVYELTLTRVGMRCGLAHYNI